MNLAAPTGISKGVVLVLELIVTIVGCNAIFNSKLFDLWTDATELELLFCTEDPACPSGWLNQEIVFAAASVFCLILSFISLISGLCVDLSESKGKRVTDGVLQIFAGIIIIAGSAILISAVRSVDKYLTKLDTTLIEIILPASEVHDGIKYTDKLAAGSLGIISGLQHLVTSVLIFKSGGNSSDKTIT